MITEETKGKKRKFRSEKEIDDVVHRKKMENNGSSEKITEVTEPYKNDVGNQLKQMFLKHKNLENKLSVLEKEKSKDKELNELNKIKVNQKNDLREMVKIFMQQNNDRNKRNDNNQRFNNYQGFDRRDGLKQ